SRPICSLINNNSAIDFFLSSVKFIGKSSITNFEPPQNVSRAKALHRFKTVGCEENIKRKK
ncbi:hypothetical protein LB570_31185, partial [Mesorhizobium sp. BR1-1-5]|nr:hypothetical protein [Mesorhizobium sp. BR1-1-5]